MNRSSRTLYLPSGGSIALTLDSPIGVMSMPRCDRDLLCSLWNQCEDYEQIEAVRAFSDDAVKFFRVFSELRSEPPLALVSVRAIERTRTSTVLPTGT